MTNNTGAHNTGHCNTGHYNTGHSNTGHYNTGAYNTGIENTGDRNTGHCNTGHFNTGDHNTGGYNTGHYNTGNRHVGSFNTVDAESAYYFNTLLPVAVWDAAYKPDWIYKPCPTKWATCDAMSAKEKTDNPSCVTTGGYMRENDMAEEWRKAYASASPEDIQAVRDLPGFDPDVFFQITGLDLRVPDDEITINGVVYVKKPNQ
jgi:hypothetical protein